MTTANPKSTEDQKLLRAETPESWRIFRIMSEFVEGFDRLEDVGKAVTIFGSARTPADDPEYQRIVDLARTLGEAGFAIITGGGPGAMEAANKGGQEAKVTSVGLDIELPFETHINPYCDVGIEFRYFFTRKTMLLKYASAIVVVPGGVGTMDELFEAVTLIQCQKLCDFPVVLFGSDYWGGLVEWMKGPMLKEGKIKQSDIDRMFVTDSAEEARDYILENYGRCSAE